MSIGILRTRKIIHIDMDAFYASVEINDNPQLKGLPVVVGGSPESRAVVTAASYEARKFGIHSAMACSQAKRLCSETIFLPPRFERYKAISAIIHGIFHRYSDLVEPLSLDEAWLDVSINKIDSPSATWLAKMIKDEIKAETGLIASAGVSYNKFLAKIASDEDKPDGLFVITPENAPDFLRHISLRKLPGVGKVTFTKMTELGLTRGDDLLNCSEIFLQNHFGKMGEYLYRLIRGFDNRPVITHRERKSIGLETTFEKDYFFGEELKKQLSQLIEGFYKRLKKAKKIGRTITLKLKFNDFMQVTRSFSNPKQSLHENEISYLLFEKMHEVCTKQFPQKKIRLIGISASNLVSNDLESIDQQLDIFQFLEPSVL